MKQNVINQTMILNSNEESNWIFQEQFWKPWRLRIYEHFMNIVLSIKQAWLKFTGLWILRTLASVVRAVFCIIFVAPLEQEKIEQTRMKAMYYRNIF